MSPIKEEEIPMNIVWDIQVQDESISEIEFFKQKWNHKWSRKSKYSETKFSDILCPVCDEMQANFTRLFTHNRDAKHLKMKVLCVVCGVKLIDLKYAKKHI